MGDMRLSILSPYFSIIASTVRSISTCHVPTNGAIPNGGGGSISTQAQNINSNITGTNRFIYSLPFRNTIFFVSQVQTPKLPSSGSAS